MENKPNNEISELLARLQQKVEKKSEPKVDSVKKMEDASPEELLSLLKKNIGTAEESSVPVNEEYDIQGYEFEEEELVDEPLEAEVLEVEEESRALSEDEEEILHNKVEELVKDSLEANEIPEVVLAAEEEPVDVPADEEFVEELPDDVVEPEMDLSEAIEEQPVIGEAPITLTEETEQDLPWEEAEEILGQPICTEMISDFVDDEPIEEEIASEEPIIESVEALELEENFAEEDFAEEPSEMTGFELEDASAKLCLREAAAKRFFKDEDAESMDASENDFPEAVDFDDVDINLALALGSREELENSVGYFRVRSAKNGFHDPYWEEATGDNAYGYLDEEFRSHEQIDAIKQRYTSERKKTKKQIVFTFLLSVLILFLEHLPMTSLQIPYVSEWLAMPIVYYGVAVLLSASLILIALKKILRGLRSLFFLRAEPFVPVSCLAALNLLYNLALFLFARQSNLPVYNFLISVFLLLGLADDAMRLLREKLTFDVVSEPKTKLSLERFEGAVDADSTSAFSPKKDFFVEKIDFVGNFFSRAGRRPAQFAEYFHEFSFSILGALLISLVSLCLGGDIASALTVFVFSILICLPMQYMTLGIYPFFHLTKGLSKLDSAVIGDAVTEEYNDANTIYLEDTEMFGKHGARIVGLRVYNDMDFYDILSYALSVFSVVGAPLCNVFDNSVREIEKKDGAKITNVSVGGLEAYIERGKTIYIGNLAFMRSRGYFPKRNPDDEKKIESGQICILYMAIGGELCAKLYMQYTVTQRFEKFAAEMIRNGIRVGIRTLDPNVNEAMIAALRGDSEISIKVIRPTPNELIPIGKHSDSGIVTSKNSHMIFKILVQCFNIKRIHVVQRRFRIGALALGVIVSLLLTVLGVDLRSIPSLYLVIYQLLWLLPSLIYTKSKLK